eukprot:CAMPEP_0180118386 /NCGR_PEP_ID=MMETSP0986-20121125/1428_1 /TAXON_ID=697907 /ORGANISM="non described non described, Strain CCMP2293" /LENGTH=603 /DNA_ID=CAMNT_0022057331 /DNA_START=17 /DNA_END=1827 /DNA_ORIENTATION=-
MASRVVAGAFSRTSSCPAMSPLSPATNNRMLHGLAVDAAEREEHMELELLEVLGRGSGGVCRKARRKEDGVLVVVKQIDISFCAPEERQAAHDEAEMQKSLRHPNIVTFLDQFEEDETLNIVMEFAPFGTLKQQIAKLTVPLPQGRVAWLFANAMEGLAFLHENKILHRDIKSDNVFICEGGIPKLGDFGVSKRLNTAQPLACSVVGTPLYVSPELCNGLAYDAKSDIWAAGCLLYELCSQGRTPFAASNHGAVIRNILLGLYTPLPQEYSEIASTLQRCLSQDPLQRPAASEVCLFVSNLADAHATPAAQHLPSTPPGAEDSARANKAAAPLSWDWAVSDGTMPGAFRSLYGGTPAAGVNALSVEVVSPTADRAEQRLNGRSSRAPPPVPDAPPDLGALDARELRRVAVTEEFSPPRALAKRKSVIQDFLHGTSVTPYMARDDLSDIAASPGGISRQGSSTLPFNINLTSVDDLSRWLAKFESAHPDSAGSGMTPLAKSDQHPPYFQNESPPPRPTSTPDRRNARGMHQHEKPPSAILGLRIGRIKKRPSEPDLSAGLMQVPEASEANSLKNLRELREEKLRREHPEVRASLPVQDKMAMGP